jgi:predicted amidohydrolase YtcJ
MDIFKKIAPCLLMMVLTNCTTPEKVDLLLHNARIYTVNDGFEVVDAMAIHKGKIVEVGAENEIKNRYRAKEILDLKGKVVFPGFIDAHCHIYAYGNTFNEVDMVGSKSWEEVLERVQAFVVKQNEGWITGRGWDQNDWQNNAFPTNKDLNELFPDRPVLLKRIDGHAAIANQKALDLAKVEVQTTVEGGIFKSENGVLTGLLIDNAVDYVQKSIPEPSADQIDRALLKAAEHCHKVGLTSLADAMTEYNVLERIKSLQGSGALKMKLYCMLMPSEANRSAYLASGPYQDSMLTIRAFKYFADGALGSRGAWLLEPYSDSPHEKGLQLTDSAELHAAAKKLYQNGFQMNTHCIGDGAVREVLNIYASVLPTPNDARWRIEHAQIVHPQDLDKFGTYNIIPSVQPTHATSDMYWAADRLGEKRVKTAYSYQELMTENGLVALGTDFPIEDISPFKTFFAAVVRKDTMQNPPQGFQMENSLSRENAIRGMTIWAAIANFEEQYKGSLEEGKAADFIILDRDLMKVNEEEVLDTKVLATYVNGEAVWEAD